jgi:CheY-like chemotaxis protein/HPt (histidine-containing phosphotransfer) domain-containing protein
MKPIKAQCFSALSGREAIELLEKEHFDLVLMDHMMPEMDGVETIRYIRAKVPQAAGTPIIALTANVMEDVREMFMREGFDGFVAKPVDIKELVSAIKRFLAPELIHENKGEADGTDREEEEADVRFEGLDWESALKSLGSASLYHMIAGEYYRSGKNKKKVISDDHDRADWEDYAINTHALKSSSRQIGAMRLGELAERMEKAGKEKDLEAIALGHGPMMEEYDSVLLKLAPYFPDQTGEGAELQEADMSLVAELLDRMEAACGELDTDAMEEVCRELGRYSYTEDMADKVNELCTAVEGFDIEGSTGIISDIRGLMG